MLTSAPDWHDAADYSGLIGHDKRHLQWEWLRRSADYRAYYTAQAPIIRSVTADGLRYIAADHPDCLSRWGLHFRR